MVTIYSPGVSTISNLSNNMLQETNIFYPQYLLVIGHLLLLLECGTSILLFTLQPMEYMYIYTTASYLKQMIQKDSVLEMTQTQPNITFLKNIPQCYLSG